MQNKKERSHSVQNKTRAKGCFAHSARALASHFISQSKGTFYSLYRNSEDFHIAGKDKLSTAGRNEKAFALLDFYIIYKALTLCAADAEKAVTDGDFLFF